VRFHSAIYRILWPGDTDFAAARTEVESTAEKIQQGGPVTGFPVLATLIDARVLAKAFQWLGVANPPTDGRSRPADGEIPHTDWEAGLIYNDKGDLKACYENAALHLENSPEWKGVLGYNEFVGGVFIMKEPPPPITIRIGCEVEDHFDTQAVRWLERKGVMVKPELVGRVVDTTARLNSFHPVRQYFASLPEWDRVPRINTWLIDYCGVDPGSNEKPNFYAMAIGAKFLISAIARIEQPACKVDHMLVLESPQGGGKSTAVRILAGDDWFTDQLSDMGSKDAAMQLRGRWIIELAELDALNRVEMSRAKAFLTQQSDRFRPPYGHRLINAPRQCVFIGTTNRHEWNTDPTGGRRFWAVRCGAIDIEALKRDRDQLWAEALYRFHQSEAWWLDDPKTAKEAVEEQEQRYVTHPWQEQISKWLQNPTERFDQDKDGHPVPVGEFSSTKDSVTIDDILVHCIGKPLDRWTHLDKVGVSNCLTALKWEQYFAGPKSRRQRRYRLVVNVSSTNNEI
jgi:predicted P-loop ATPase